MNDLHTTPSFKALDEGRLQPVDKGVVVTPEAMAAAIEAERGVIFAARSIANRDCGGSQTEMREAREAYMIDAFAKFEREVIARHQSGRTGAGEALREAATDALKCLEVSVQSFPAVERKLRAALSQSTAGEDGA